MRPVHQPLEFTAIMIHDAAHASAARHGTFLFHNPQPTSCPVSRSSRMPQPTTFAHLPTFLLRTQNLKTQVIYMGRQVQVSDITCWNL
jgi:hypothetical protein